jgi:nucleotide-binding universal stress UspA family protein
MENATTETSTGSRVIVPLDGSEMSDKALNKAIEFATALKSEMIILHIVDNRFIPPSATLGFISEQSIFEDAKTQLVKILKVGAELMLKDRMAKVRGKGVNVKFLMEVGSPGEEIVNVAKNEKVDLIIMGSRQLKKTEKLMALGSVARRVSGLPESPVMIVH